MVKWNMVSVSIQHMAISHRYVIARQGRHSSSSVLDIWATVGIIIAALVVSCFVAFLIILSLRRRRKNEMRLPSVIKSPRQWYRRHNSVQEILKDEELERITQIRKSLQGRGSSRNSQSSETTTSRSTTPHLSSDFSIQKESTNALREDLKEWEHRLQSSTPTSVRDLEAQGHPAFSPRSSRPGSSRTPTEEGSIKLPERREQPQWPLRDDCPISPQPPSPARVVDKEVKRTRRRPSSPPPYAP